jgi:enoyl-CoA hydratase
MHGERSADERIEHGLLLRRNGAAAVAVLADAGHDNSVSRLMQAELAAWYPALARDPGVYAVVLRSGLPGRFSSSGDLGELHALSLADPAAARKALEERYALCWLHECFSKPTVSLINGDVRGAGIGITLYGTHRVAGDDYGLRFDEPALGWVPDCGVAHALARMPHGIGLFLALTGAPVGTADAHALGLVTHCIPAEAFAGIEARLADADPVDPVLDDLHRLPSQGPLMQTSERIARYFDAASLAQSLERLASPRPGDAEWVTLQLAALRARSPLSLCLSHRAIRTAASLDIRDTLIQDYRLTHRLLPDPTLGAGLRASHTGRGNAPAWQPARIEDVSEAQVTRYFAAPEGGDLALPSRAEMQAARI